MVTDPRGPPSLINVKLTLLLMVLVLFGVETSTAFTPSSINSCFLRSQKVSGGRASTTKTFLAKYRPNSNKPPPPPPKNNGGGEDLSFDNKSDRNWIEKSSPTGTGDGGEVDDYTLRIHGPTFQLGPLSLRIYNALMDNAAKRFEGDPDKIPSELIPVYKAYAMDMACREATKAALKHNGLQMIEDAADADKVSGMPGMWGEVENFEILAPSDSNYIPTPTVEDEQIVATSDSIQEAVSQEKWAPGQQFNFIVRNVKAQLPEMTLKDLMKTLDMEEIAKEMGVEIGDIGIGELGIELQDDDEDDEEDDDDTETLTENDIKDYSTVDYSPIEVNSLTDLRQDCENRCNSVPTRAAAVGYAGGSGRGYEILSIDQLMNDSTRVIDACGSHGFAILDLGSGTTEEEALALMWNVTDNFFTIVDTEKEIVLPTMENAFGVKNAVVGYASYENNSMQFLETRLVRSDGNSEEKLVPEEVATIIGKEGVECIKRAQHVLLDLGRDVARIAVASSLIVKQKKDEEELTPVITGIALDKGSPSSSISEEHALASATIIIDSLMDHGQPSLDGTTSAGTINISMSPHRMCRYTDNGSNPSASATEVFGAHTDTTFVTVIPVAAVSGLEVYDIAAEAWTRPELMARRHWENEQMEQKRDPSSSVGGNGQPWHARYVVCMPGELLELVTQQQILTAVHRVVAASGGTPRISAPVLVRARPKAVLDVEKLYGSNDANAVEPLLASCNKMTMEEIHDSLQPSAT